VSLQLNNTNKLYLSAFVGNDRLGIAEQSGTVNSVVRIRNESVLSWGNFTSTAHWFSVIGGRTTLSTVATFTDYNADLSDFTTRTPTNGEAFSLSSSIGSGIKDYTLKSTLTKNTSAKRVQETGIFVSRRIFKPSIFSSQNLSTRPDTVDIRRFATNEIGAFVSEKHTITPTLTSTYGLRYTMLLVRGRTYQLLEPRASLAYQLPDGAVLKMAFDRTTQSVNLLQSSGFGLSTDLYVPSTAQFRPQVSNQITVGYEVAAKNQQAILSVESYLKRQSNILGFREGVSLFLLGDDPRAFSWEENTTAGRGLSYGLEAALRKPNGKLTGWISYTWAKSIVQFDDLNNGLPFYPFQDRRHDLSVVATLKLSKRVHISGNWILTTGFPITLPLGYYYTGLDPQLLTPANYYGGRNIGRMPAYHRLDLSLTLHPKRIKRFSGNWELGVFNAYNRRNAFNAFLQLDRRGAQNPGLMIRYDYLLPIIPSISYHFRF
jgi:hypothetical protein